MRQWMVNPRILCKLHLGGENLEHWMFLGSIRVGKTKWGHYPGMLEIKKLHSRHVELAAEMTSRGWNHKKPITNPMVHHAYVIGHGNTAFWDGFFQPEPTIDVAANERELWRRCQRCRNRMAVLGYRFPLTINT